MNVADLAGHLERCELVDIRRLPTNRMQGIKVVLAVAILLGLVLAIIGAATDLALVQFKTSHAFFTLSSDHARALHGTEEFSTESCKRVGAWNPTRITAGERAALCNLLGTPEMREYVARTVREQRWLIGPASLMLAYLLLLLIEAIRSVNAARDMHRRIEDRANRARGTSVRDEKRMALQDEPREASSPHAETIASASLQEGPILADSSRGW